MKNNNLLFNLEKHVYFSKGSKFHKIAKRPMRLFFSKFLELVAKLSNSPIKLQTKTFWGEKMLVVIPEVVSLYIYRYGFFEEGLTKIILEYLKPGMTFFDIGAHFGYFTLLASYCVGDNGQVHSFEPIPSTFSILKINTSKKKNVRLNNLAVFSKKGTICIHDYGLNYSAFNSLYRARLPENVLSKLSVVKHKVETISIDEYVDATGAKPDFIKIDAESAEFEILSGMQKTIEKYHPIITIEVGDYGVSGVPSSKELIKYAISKGYRPYEYSEGKIKIHNIKDTYQYDNILLLPEN